MKTSHVIFWCILVNFCVDYAISDSPAIKNLLRSLGFNKNLVDLSEKELIVVVVGAAEKYAQLKSVALSTIVATYSCMRFEMYEKYWNLGGSPSEDFVIDYIPEYLPDNSKENYKNHHKIWNGILNNPNHPGAKRFTDYLMKKYGVEKNGKKVLNTELISRSIAFAIVMFQNLKHGEAAKKVSMNFFTSAQEVRKALDEVHCIEDPDILDVIEMFEEVIRGKEKYL